MNVNDYKIEIIPKKKEKNHVQELSQNKKK